MRDRWVNLCQHLFRLRESDKTPERLYQYLEAMYNRLGYHTLSHIEDCLSMLDQCILSFNIKNAKIIEFALWLHDSVYCPGSSDNEIKSADVAETIIRVLSQDTEILVSIQDVRRLILATTPFQCSDIKDEQIISDTDLSILGSSGYEYEKYAQSIRDEFIHVDDFCVKRQLFLKEFLQQPRIFQTNHMRNILEEAARINILREIYLRGK